MLLLYGVHGVHKCKFLVETNIIMERAELHSGLNHNISALSTDPSIILLAKEYLQDDERAVRLCKRCVPPNCLFTKYFPAAVTGC